MANLINANLNQNYFQFHGSRYKYEKRVPLGLPISRSTFKNFLKNLEGKFIKSSSKSRTLIHYPTGCPRRHCTPDLFISSYQHRMDPADPRGKPSWSLQVFMRHHILFDLFHGIHGVQEMQVTVTMAHNRVGARSVIRCAQVGTTWQPWQWQRGCCTTPTNTLTC